MVVFLMVVCLMVVTSLLIDVDALRTESSIMEPRHFLTASRVLIVAGKGGVGKSTVATALANLAVSVGLHTLFVEIEGKRPLSDLSPDVEFLALQPGAALSEYLDSHGLARISRRLVTSGIVDIVASTAPGIDDLLTLGKIKQLERTGEYDVIIVDGPPAGQALGLLRAPLSMKRAVVAGPVRQQADDVIEMLGDSSRCRLMLVTAPETTPVTELIDTAFELEEDLDIALAPVVVNGVDTDAELLALTDAVIDAVCAMSTNGASLWEAADYRRRRVDRHAAACELLSSKLPLRQIRLPRITGDVHVSSRLVQPLSTGIEEM